MEYPFVYIPGLRSTSFSMHVYTIGVYRNGASVNICTCGWWNIVQVKMLHWNSVQFCCGTDDSVAVKRHKV